MPEYDRLLVVAPHPDDEVFGCWGLLLQQLEAGRHVSVVFLTEGSGAHRTCCHTKEDSVGMERSRLALKVADSLDLAPSAVTFLGEKDGCLPHESQPGFKTLSMRLQETVESFKPQAVFCPHPFEGWSDHMAAAELTRAALSGSVNRPRLYYYCVWFWLNMPLRRARHINWRQARVLDINHQWHQKKRAMQVYLDARAPCGNPWIGRLPEELLRAFEWDKELFFEV